MYKPNDNYYRLFSVSSSSGNLVNADSLPSGLANKNGVDDSSFKLYVANLATGRYVVSGVIPAYAKGDVVNVGVYATVGGIQSFANLESFEMDSKRIGDLNDFNAGATAVTTSGGTVTNTTQVGGMLPPTNFNNLKITGSGLTQIDPTQYILGPQTPGTHGYALASAEVQGVGKWSISGSGLNLYRVDGTLFKTLYLDSVTAPTLRQ